MACPLHLFRSHAIAPRMLQGRAVHGTIQRPRIYYMMKFMAELHPRLIGPRRSAQ